MMDGRVKTLHPKIHGALLGVRENPDHAKAMETHGIQPIDMVVINLYPFEETVIRGAGRDEVIENIDIGGPAMIRSAGKNHAFVTIVSDPADYPAGAFSDPAHLARLNAIFPAGVCDWTQPSVGQVPATAIQWSTFSGSAGFAPLPSKVA